MTLIERSFREKIVLVGVAIPPGTTSTRPRPTSTSWPLLVDTAGADVMAARVLQRRDAPDPATYVGKGKAEELRELSLAVDADTVVFDDELSPAQQRNLEKILGRTAIDRTDVILDIFAQNARTQEGKAQVELALLRYRLPAAAGPGQAAQPAGGRHGRRRGPRRSARAARVRRSSRSTAGACCGASPSSRPSSRSWTKNRQTQRKARGRSRLRTVSIVGYTNAGKSTLLNRAHRRRRAGRGPAVRHPRPPHPAAGPARRRGGAAVRHRRLRAQAAAPAGRGVPVDAGGRGRVRPAGARGRRRGGRPRGPDRRGARGARRDRRRRGARAAGLQQGRHLARRCQAAGRRAIPARSPSRR